MKKQNQNNDWFTPSEAFNVNDSVRHSGISHFVERTHSLHTFYLIAGLCQVALGLGVVTIVVLGLLSSFWLSAAMLMLSSITTMIGLYLVYIMMTRSYSKKSLLRNAIRRIMEFKN